MKVKKVDMKNFSITPVILSGGSGTRLWPLSREFFPKQFLVFAGNTSLFQQAVDRLQSLKSYDTNEILIVANEEHRFLVQDQLRDMGVNSADILLEPLARNTAPALTIAALQALSTQQNPILIVIPADHIIKDKEAFITTIERSIKVAAEGNIVILGVKPNRADIGFGYIKQKGCEGEYKEFDVDVFKEKPDLTLAEKYFNNEDYTWNSGIFVMYADVWLDTLGKFRPDILNASKRAFDELAYDGAFIRPNPELFEKIPSESIDYAVMEKLPDSNLVKMIILDADWDDLGSWNALWKIGKKDYKGNVVYGDCLINDTQNSLIYSNARLVATSGLKDIVIIETADSILVIDRNQTQDVKMIVNQLVSKKREESNLHRKVFRPWGWFDTLDQGDRFKVKRIQVNPGASLSLQRHSKRAEHWVVVKGFAEVVCENKTLVLKENESIYIPLGSVHKLSNPSQDVLEIIEVQSGHYLGEDDIERFQDSYGRRN